MIRILALDIDGVLTTGEVFLDEDGRETKALFFRDIDAVFHARRQGLELALVSGEATPLVDVIAARFGIERVYRGAKDKAEALRALAADTQTSLDEICFVGDAPRDVPALELAGLALAPADADVAALEAADIVLTRGGGRGAVAEAVAIALDRAS